MGNPIVHFEIRSNDPDAGRTFYSDLFGWTFADAAPDHVKDYAYIDSQSDRATIHGGISPLQGGEPRVVVYAEVENISETVSQAVELGATIVQDPYDVPGVTIAVIADPPGRRDRHRPTSTSVESVIFLRRNILHTGHSA